MVLSPLFAARSQLLTAIDLFFTDGDPVSVHALAGNAREILESLCRLAAVEPVTELLLRDHPSKPKKDIYAALNRYRNCFKTWEERRGEQAVLNQFEDTKNEYLLYVCVEDYLRLRGSSPFPMQVLHAWFCAVHGELVGSCSSHRPHSRDSSSLPGCAASDPLRDRCGRVSAASAVETAHAAKGSRI